MSHLCPTLAFLVSHLYLCWEFGLHEDVADCIEAKAMIR